MVMRSIAEIVATAEETNQSIAELMIQQEMEENDVTREDVIEQMRRNLETMKAAVKRGSTGDGVQSSTGLTGGDAIKMKKYRQKGDTLSGDIVLSGVQAALATNEVNAAMGIVCATPTAGSTGTLPGILTAISETMTLTEEQELDFLFTAALFGMVVANNAMIAGAVGGCQAEIGSASAMGAAAAVAVKGGTPQQSAEAFGMAMGNLLGLVCDPVAGLVEIPCVKRNAIGSTNALICADMALAGIENKIPADEVVEAMRQVGVSLPSELRETGIGGMAGTPTGIQMKINIFGNDLSEE